VGGWTSVPAGFALVSDGDRSVRLQSLAEQALAA
jgi:hypothetical protein